VNDLCLEQLSLLLVAVVFEGGHNNNEHKQHDSDGNDDSRNSVVDFRVNNLGIAFCVVDVDLVGLVVKANVNIWVEHVTSLIILIGLSRGNNNWVVARSCYNSIADDLNATCSDIKDWCSKIDFPSSKCFCLLLLKLFKFT